MQINASEIYFFIVTAILLISALAIFIIYFIITYYKRQKENEREKQLLESRFREDWLRSTIEIQEKVFEDISRELHDNIGQQLSAASIYLNLASQDPGEPDPKLLTCRDIISGSLQDLRSLSQTLLGEKISDLGLIGSLDLEIKKINKLGISTARLCTTASDIEIDRQKQIILFRIIQEAISNAIKHAPGCRIVIHLDEQPDQIRIRIADNGRGFDTTAVSQNGIGLLNMHRRAQTIGADFSLQSSPGQGTQVTICLPTR